MGQQGVRSFDHVQHDILLRLLRRRIQDDKLIGLIHQMVKAGVMENSLFKKTDEGTPQGGVASPLLANIYLHELDEWMHVHYLDLDYLTKQYRRNRHEGNAFYVRYADDFVVAWNGTKEGAEALKQELRDFLRDSLGLELSEDKTAITHVTDGYDFLGFTIRRIVQPAKGYDKLLFYPSKDSVMKVKHKIKLMTKRKTTLPSVHDKIEALNYLLRGWGNYFRHSAASATLDYVGSYAFQRMDHWLRKKTGKRQRALYRRYYRRCERGYVTFIDNGMALFHPGVELKISYYRWRNLPNPYLDNPEDVRLPYHLDPLGGKEWSGDHAYGSTWTETRAMVRQRDSSRCVHCGSAQRVEVHHLRLHQPNRKHNPLKLVSLCRTCHNKARNPRSEVSRTLSRLHFVTGEPDDAKVSRPVREEA